MGDSPATDIEGARTMGMRAVLVDRDGGPPGPGGVVVPGLADLPRLLAEGLG